MKMKHLTLIFALAIGAWAVKAQNLDSAIQSKVNEQIKAIQTWASDPIIIKAVKDHNASLPAAHAELTQEKWKSLTLLDPLVRSFSKNEAGLFLKSKKTDGVTEAFLSDANGLKVAFLSKTTSWSHKGKPKHDDPMNGKNWQGPVEVDESTGLQQIQVSVPVMDGGKPIGSLVVGLGLSKLK